MHVVQVARSHAPCMLLLDSLEAAAGPVILSTQARAAQAHKVRTGVCVGGGSLQHHVEWSRANAGPALTPLHKEVVLPLRHISAA